MHSKRIDLTTNSSQAASGTTTAPDLSGLFYGFALVLGTATAADVTIKNAEGLTLYTKASLSASGMYLVTRNAVDNAGSAAAGVYPAQPVTGPLTVTIANGGDTKTLSIIVYIG